MFVQGIAELPQGRNGVTGGNGRKEGLERFSILGICQ